MRVISRFRFDHEPGDSARDSATLQQFRGMGLEMGADVTVWYCAPCDFAEAQFAYARGMAHEGPGKERDG